MNETTTPAENRLRYEKSPYLLQHAQDPVHWWSWCPGAFHAAKQEDKPIFLSIGYSACHWCHEMARETFQDPDAAAALNRDFIAVKVDREERPDIDAVYMAACQALTGSGGWPLTVLMTPDQQPFWAGTYLPPRGRQGQLGLAELLDEAARLWHSDRQRLLDLGKKVTRHIAYEPPSSPVPPDRTLLLETVNQLRRRYDPQNGGFGSAPKFPSAHDLLFLLAYARSEGDELAREMALTTLEQMSRGGIFDQIGGGFCRYSTDAAWRIPHFEKMLYDNALLSIAYLEAYAQTGRARFREIACRTLDYALEELRLPGGGFACAQDADSGGREGGYYLLTRAGLEEALSPAEAGAICRRLSIGGAESVPHLLDDPAYASFWPEHSEACRKAAAYRRRRPLHRDEKVLTAWNAMMIAALAKAGRVLGEERYLRAAQDARLFLKTRLTQPDGRLWHCWRGREAAIEGQLEDYAFYCWALVELYEATFAPAYLREAANLADQMKGRFWDGDSGGFYRTSAQAGRLLVRQKDSIDAGTPSGGGAAALALTKLARLTGADGFRTLAQSQLAWLAGDARDNPAARCFALYAMTEALYPRRELVCVSSGGIPPWLAGVGEAYRLSVVAKTPDNARALANLIPSTAGYPLPGRGETLYYLCREGSCAPPVDTLDALRGLLSAGRELVLG